MLDIQLLRKQSDHVKQALSKRNFELDVEAFAVLDQNWKDAETHIQQLQAERNKVSKCVGELIKSGSSVEDAKKEVAEQLQTIDEQLSDLATKARDAQKNLDEFLIQLPNIPADDVPRGTCERENQEIMRWGELPTFDFEVKDHVDLGVNAQQLDFDAAAKITGSRFTVMRGGIAAMHRALIAFMLDTHIREHGYQEVYVPYIVNQDSLYGTGQLPKFAEDLFKLEGTDYYLIPTAEVPVTNLLRDVIADTDGKTDLGKLPLKLVTYTPCFRSEAGSYGRDTRGMIRQHQFEKVELVQFVYPEQGPQALEDLTQHAENILQKLKLPYRKVLLCGGDIGFSSHKTYDLEVWLPSQDMYREISSCSYFDSFQARRMSARYRDPNEKKPQLLHTLNGSGLAVGRCLLAIMENYQQADGTIKVPEALRFYMGGLEFISAGMDDDGSC